jgi:serine protease inhibitor
VLFRSELVPVDYAANPEAARLKINAWADKETNHLIKDIIPDEQPPLLTQDAVLTLVNAIYFKGQWISRFDASETTSRPFFREDGGQVMVPMMKQENRFNYGEDNAVQVLEMPYAGGDLSMMVFLPRGKTELRRVEDSLSEHGMTAWSNALYKQTVEVNLPRFEIISAVRLKQPLIDMGMKDAFTAKEADFSGVGGSPHELFLKFVLHKAFVVVNEAGTEAAATTAVGCFPPGTPVLTESGLRSIEAIQAGTRVHACDLSTGEWVLAEVVECHSLRYEGDVITVSLGRDSIESTGNQPFFVVRGSQLAARPLPRDVTEEEQRGTRLGRWVEARDLREGDVLKNLGGEPTMVSGLHARQSQATRVYWLEIKHHHNCAVHRLGILAHNMKKSLPARFLADHPFLFLVRETQTKSVLFMGRVADPSAK